jgi:hypothetical protein
MRRALRELQRSKTAVVETSASHRVTLASQKRHTLQNVTGNVTVINRRMDREHKDRTSSKLRTRKWRAKLAGDAVGDENVTAPSSGSSSKEEDLVSKKNRKEEGLRCESEDPPPAFFSEEFFDNLQDQKKFQHFDVREVFGKWKNHCQVSGKELDPKYFLNWLNRERGDLRNASSDEEISRIVARLS